MSESLPAFSLSDIYRLRLCAEPAVSPDGQRVAFLIHGFREKENDRYQHLWLADVQTGELHQLTRGFTNESAPAWSPDGRFLACLSTRDDEREVRAVGREDKDGGSKSQVWVFDVEHGGEPRQVTSRSEGVTGFDWSPDGRQLVIAARDPSAAQLEYLKSIRGQLGAEGDKGPYVFTRIQHKMDGEGYLDNVKTHLFVVDVASRQERRLTDGPCDEAEPRWSPDGQWVAFTSNRTGDADNNRRTDLWLVSPDGGETRRVTFGDLDASNPRWSPDSRTLAFGSPKNPDNNYWDLIELMTVSLDAAEPVDDLAACVGVGWSDLGGVIPGRVEGDPVAHARRYPTAERSTPCRVLTEGLDRPVEGPAVWLNADEVLVPIGDRGQRKLAAVSVEAGARTVYPADDHYCSIEALDVAGGTIAMIVNRPEAGSDLVVLPVEALGREGVDQQARRLTQVNQAVFGERAAVRYDRFIFQNSQGQEVEGIAVLPPGFDPGQGPAPLVLLPHGGPVEYDSPTLQFSRGWFAGEAFLAGQGYLVLVVNFRGSSSYGQAFTNEIRGDLGQREYDDVMSGVQHLIDKGWADPERLFITGCSYGGFMTAWVTGSTDSFKAAVAELPWWDLALGFGPSDLATYLQQDFGLPLQNPEGYRTSSPSHLTLNVTTPTLIHAGQVDWRCPASMAEMYYVTLKKLGVPAELVIYQNEHHATTRPRVIIDRMRRICSWFARYGGQPFSDNSAEGYPGPA